MYEDFQIDKDKFDFSEYSENQKIYGKANKKVIGKIKDESKDFPVVEFVDSA